MGEIRLRKKDRRFQGIINGKRYGVTENIGAAARKRWGESSVCSNSSGR